MMARTQVTFPPEIHKRARRRAADLGVSLAEYVRGLVARDLGEPEQRADVSSIFGLGDSGGTDIARDKDRLIGEAVEAEWLRKTRRR